MESQTDNKIFRALPVQVMQFDDGAMLKRGTLETFVKGERALEVLQLILETMQKGASCEETYSLFSELDRPGVEYLLDQLISRRVVVPADEMTSEVNIENPEDVFYWDFGRAAGEVRVQLKKVRFAIVGVNEVSLELFRCLDRCGVDNCRLVDHSLLRNARLFRQDGEVDASLWSERLPLSLEEWEESLKTESVDCLIATSDFGGLHWMRDWNKMCVTNGIKFFPVVLQNMIGYIGPLVIPGETACFECVRSRQNSILSNPRQARLFEKSAFEDRRVTGFHPVMPAAAAQIATIEIVKFFSQALPFVNIASVIELNMLVPGMTVSKVLKIPNCAVCKTRNHHGSPISTMDKFTAFNPSEAE